MVNFVTLFLGLVLGPQVIEVSVSEGVARVEIVVDDATIGALEGEPWTTEYDFGDKIVPHELVAVAYDPEGREVARALQHLNLPRRPVEATVVVSGDPEGKHRTAHVSWESRNGTRPVAVRVTFDDTELVADDATRIDLPPHDPEGLHFLRVELEFDDGASLASEVAFGGSYLDSVSSEVTAIPVELDGRRKLPKPEKLTGWFEIGSMIPQVLAAETGEADIFVVRSRLSVGDLRWAEKQELSKALPDAHWRRSSLFGSQEWELRMIWPISRAQSGNRTPFELFPYSEPQHSESGSLVRWITETDPPEDLRGHQRLADAVAVAGVSAASGSGRRAVVLILGQEEPDESTLAPESAKAYLRSLRVPFFVWSTRPESPAVRGWGPVADVSTAAGLKQAVDGMLAALEKQRIVWLAGNYMPHTVALTPSSEGVVLAD